MKKIIIAAIMTLAVCACGVYSFTGTSIQPDVKTINIDYITYQALKVNPSLSNELTEALRTRFRRMTSLEQVDIDGDLQMSGYVKGYDVSASSIAANDQAAQNRLTVVVSITFKNTKHPEDDFEKDFSAYANFDANLLIESVQSTLCTEIIDKLVEDIFNASVAQW